MGRVLQFSSNKQALLTNGQAESKTYSREESKSIETIARGLLAFACKVGWEAVSELMLPVVTAVRTSMADLVEDLEHISDEGLTLLHHAVRSKNAAVVSVYNRHSLQNAACPAMRQ